MSLPNQVENRILIIGTAVVMFFAFTLVVKTFVIPPYKAQIKMLTKQNEAKDAVIAKMARDPKYAINNTFDKMKPKDGGYLVIDLNNELDVKNNKLDVMNVDTIATADTQPPEKKKGFFKKFKFW